jgi:hypothetical protein
MIFCGRLGDGDDDVRSVAASCLLPVAVHLVEQLPESLDRVLTVLWGCLSGMKDDLSSSVGAVMELLGRNKHFCSSRNTDMCLQENLSRTTKSSILLLMKRCRMYPSGLPTNKVNYFSVGFPSLRLQRLSFRFSDTQ